MFIVIYIGYMGVVNGVVIVFVGEGKVVVSVGDEGVSLIWKV